MLRNISARTVTTKQGLMGDHTTTTTTTTTSLISPNKNPSNNSNNNSPISSFLASPRLFNGFLCSDTQHSPTSILDLKNSPSFINPFGYDRALSKPQNPVPETSNYKPGGIGIALMDKKRDGCVTRAALSKLKIQIPSTEKRQVLCLKEMEMSEDYTCVIIHGPNPKTKHIFDDCVVGCEFYGNGGNENTSAGFIRFCHTCREVLGQGKDIYMYRGEKGFCSQECRSQQIHLEALGDSLHSLEYEQEYDAF